LIIKKVSAMDFDFLMVYSLLRLFRYSFFPKSAVGRGRYMPVTALPFIMVLSSQIAIPPQALR
jgi:hypothetical protein